MGQRPTAAARFIDFDCTTENDFLVINQFKVELISGHGRVIPDAVCFINGIPYEPAFSLAAAAVPLFAERSGEHADVFCGCDYA